jgi:hypothetical protein
MALSRFPFHFHPATCRSVRVLWPAAAAWAAACAGPGQGAPSARGPGAVATEEEWRALASPRPAPLAGAPRVALGEIVVLVEPSWSVPPPLPATLGLEEIVAAGLLQRADVRYVERRRFAAAAAAEQAGIPRPAEAPRAGVSPGAEYLASMVWAPLGSGRTSLEVRLVTVASGVVAASHRALAPADADPVGLARLTVRAILGALTEMGRLPSGSASTPGSNPSEYVPSGISARAVQAFFTGLAAEESWRWDAAREAYQAAARERAFSEAAAALARAARLRLGGTLGES